jgi:hypothetical protein
LRLKGAWLLFRLLFRAPFLKHLTDAAEEGLEIYPDPVYCAQHIPGGRGYEYGIDPFSLPGQYGGSPSEVKSERSGQNSQKNHPVMFVIPVYEPALTLAAFPTVVIFH